MLKFSGKELDDIRGLYDHGARNRNPITAVWYGIDELFEKYPENGPYGYCGGNLVRFVDLDGRKITDEMEQVSQEVLKEANKMRLRYETLMNEHKSWENSEDQDQRTQFNQWKMYYDDLANVKSEIDALREDPEVTYDVEYGAESDVTTQTGPDTRSSTRWVEGGRIVKMRIWSKSDKERKGHEMKHMYQFLTGKLSLTRTGEGISLILYDMTDEDEAYFRESALKGSNVPIPQSNYKAVPKVQMYKSLSPVQAFKVGRRTETHVFKYNGKLNINLKSADLK